MYISTLSRVIPFIIAGCVISSVLLIPTATAQETCFRAAFQNEVKLFEIPTSCDNPLQMIPAPSLTATILINGQVVEDGDTVEIDFSESVSVDPSEASQEITDILRREGNVYFDDADHFQEIYEPGDYIIGVFIPPTGPGDEIIVETPELDLPGGFDFTNSGFALINFTVVEDSVEETPEPLSDLLLQFEPILYFHEDEDYFPMNLDAFVEGSGLWNGSIGVVTRGDNNGLNLDSLALPDNTEEMAIQFSSDDTGTFDLAEAKNRYDALVASGDAEATYYAYETEDSYTDDFGTEHEFFVLQYWYFYAMNNWGEQGGYNNHEGDWESVFVFLDKDSKEPEYVAFSAHHNDGDPSLDFKQYDSVRREWSKVTADGDQVSAYVALGSHANYSVVGNHSVINPLIKIYDETSDTGRMYTNDSWQQRILLQTEVDTWFTTYEGLFGADGEIIDGSAGTQGPYYSDVSGTVRFHNPIEWAGIDQTAKTTLSTPQQVFNLSKQKVKLVFDETLEAGTELSSQWYQEIIDFGSNYGELTLLPHFWDFGTSLDNDTFSVDVSLGYSEAELAELGITENNLGVYYFNEVNGLWEYVSSLVDMENNEVTFTTAHFSLYTIGVAPSVPDPAPETEEPEASSSGGSSTRTSRNSRPAAQVAGITTMSWQEILLQTYTELLQIRIDLLNETITQSEANEAFRDIIEKLSGHIESLRK